MNPNSVHLNSMIDPKRSVATPPEGSEGLLPLPKQGAVTTEKPSRAGQIGEGSYEGTDGYAKRMSSYLQTADVEQDAADAAPNSRSEALEMLAAEAEGASHSKAPGK